MAKLSRRWKRWRRASAICTRCNWLLWKPGRSSVAIAARPKCCAPKRYLITNLTHPKPKSATRFAACCAAARVMSSLCRPLCARQQSCVARKSKRWRMTSASSLPQRTCSAHVAIQATRVICQDPITAMTPMCKHSPASNRWCWPRQKLNPRWWLASQNQRSMPLSWHSANLSSPMILRYAGCCTARSKPVRTPTPASSTLMPAPRARFPAFTLCSPIWMCRVCCTLPAGRATRTRTLTIR